MRDSSSIRPRWLITASPVSTSTANYVNWLAGADIEGIVATADTLPRDLTMFQALLLSGGGDVAPSLYGAQPAPETCHVDPARDQMELNMIDEFRAAGRPVFGICRGIQILNVALCGRLIQHVPNWLDCKAPHTPETHSRPGHGADAEHGLRLMPGTAFAAMLGGVSHVNSWHHQAIDPDAVGGGLRVAARSPAGIIEAVESHDQGATISAVQWHPERMPRQHPAAGGLLAGWRQAATTALARR